MTGPHFSVPRRDLTVPIRDFADPSNPSNTPTRRLLPPAAGPKMRVLSVLSSSNQMYSGIGRALFEFTSRLLERVDFEFAIDDLHPKNVNLVLEFGKKHDIPVHVGPALTTSRSLDSFNSMLPTILRRTDFDLVEALCWANTSTNEVLLKGLGDRALVYTPYYQPLWSVPMTAETAVNTDDIHHRMVRRSDAVLCASPWERQLLQRQAHGRNNCSYLACGVNSHMYQPGPLVRKPQILFVGDLAEPRKRFDRILKILPALLYRWPELKLVVIGNGSDAAMSRIPEELRPFCELRGYVTEAEVRQAYAESQAVILLSEFEAFGIPILEGLISGTPVFLTDIEVTRSLFEQFKGAHFCPGDDADATLAIVKSVLERGPESIADTISDRERLKAQFDWDALVGRKWQAMASAWFTRHYLDRPFQGPRTPRATARAAKA